MKGIVGAIVALVVLVALIRSGHHSNNTPSATTAAAVSAPRFEVVASQSSCQENPAATSVNCSIAVKNLGDDAGTPTVYADYHYTDGGDSADNSRNGRCGGTDAIPPGQLGFVYFCHNYNALQHDVARVAVALDLGANRWPYVRVVAPGANWP